MLTLGKDDPPVEITSVPYFTEKLKDRVIKQWDEFAKGWEYELPEYQDDDEGDIVRL